MNLTLLAFTIASSFQKSPFLHFSSATYSSFSTFKTIKAQKLFSSFFITQTSNSFSVIEGSTFNHFITSLPILSFTSNQFETKIKDQTFYGDTIPSSRNKFFRTNYTEIINCKFMSITDDEKEQAGSQGGLCIFSTKSTLIDSCYFFAIMSLRSGSAILFEQDENDVVHGTVVNCIFKSITQIIHYENYLSGGAIAYGCFEMLEDYEYGFHYITSSYTNNCCFEKVRLNGLIYAGGQCGVVSYFSTYIESKNLNFSACEIEGDGQQSGFITYYWIGYSENSFSFINIFDCTYKEYGAFTVDHFDFVENQVLTLSFASFINNSNVSEEFTAQFTIIDDYSNQIDETSFELSNIQCNSNEPFMIYVVLNFEEDSFTIDVTVSNSFFGCSSDSFVYVMDDIYVDFELNLDNCIFDYTDFNVEITNNIISNFGYIQTSQFSPSSEFSGVQTSSTYFDLYYQSSFAIIVIAIILSIISIIVLFIILCYRRKTSVIDIEQFTQLDFDDEIEDENKNIEISNDSDRKI